MSSAHEKDVSYGRLGEATYDSTTKGWSFQRRPGLNCFISAAGPTELVLTGSLSPDEKPVRQDWQDRDRNIKELLGSDPFLAPAGFLLEPLHQVSEAVLEATTSSEPPSRDLVSFGVGKSISLSGRSRPVELVAVAGGISGEGVRVLYSQQAGDGVLLRESLALEDGHSLFWKGAASCPVEQISFSSSAEGPGPLLAIRNAKCTTILRPMLRGHLQTYDTLEEEDLPVEYQSIPSYVEPGQVAEIKLEDTNGHRHLSVCFNPWAEGQVAIVDISGGLTVYSCQAGTHKSEHILPLDQKTLLHASDRSIPISMDWAKVIWVGTSTLILVSRKSATIQTVGLQPHTSKLPELYLGQAELLVDLIQDPFDLSCVYILTTARLSSYRVHDLADPEDQNEGQQSAVLLVTWRHQLSEDDLTYRMIIHHEKSTEDLSIIMIYSKRSEMVMCFTFAYGDKIGYSMSDPFYIPQALDSSNLPVSVVMCPPRGSGEDEFSTSSSRFFLLQLGDDLSLYQQEFQCSQTHPHYDKHPQSPLSHRRDSRSSRRSSLRRSASIRSRRPYRSTSRQERTRSQSRARNDHDIDTGPLDTGIEDLETVIKELATLLESEETKRSPPGNFDDAIEQVLSDRAEVDTGLHTMAEFLSTDLPLDNIDKFSNTVQEILNGLKDALAVSPSDVEDEPALASQPLLSMSQAGELISDHIQTNEIILVPLYENLLNQWISKLGVKIPGRARVFLERSARKIAMQVYLSAYGVRSITQDEIANVQTEPPKKTTRDLDLAIREKPRDGKRRSSATSMSPNTRDSRYDSQRSPSTGTTGQASSQHSPTSQVPTSAISNSSNRFKELRKFATFKEPTHVGKSITKLTNLWELGEDPDGFDWQLAREVGQRQESTVPKSKRRKAFQRSKIPASSQSQLPGLSSQIRSSPPPIPNSDIFESSQLRPGQMLDTLGGIPSSQWTSHSGREKKRKKRKAGF